MIISRHDSEEIATLAEHQLEILKRRFPNYKHSMCHMNILGLHNCSISVSNKTILLQISFRSSSVEIVPLWTTESIIIDYADPKFTDDTISDTLKSWKKTSTGFD